MPIRLLLLIGCAFATSLPARPQSSSATLPPAPAREHRFLYVAEPGIRNYVEHGGIGVLVFDVDNGHRFVRRIPTMRRAGRRGAGEREGHRRKRGDRTTLRQHHEAGARLRSRRPRRAPVESRVRRRLRPTWRSRPTARLLYVPSFEGPHWHVLDALTGDPITRIVTGSGAHNTVYGPRWPRGLSGRAEVAVVVDCRPHAPTQSSAPSGRLATSIRPFTVNGAQTRCFVNVNDLLGFEVGDLTTGKMLHRVEVRGFEKGPTKRHGCPSPRRRAHTGRA